MFLFVFSIYLTVLFIWWHRQFTFLYRRYLTRVSFSFKRIHGFHWICIILWRLMLFSLSVFFWYLALFYLIIGIIIFWVVIFVSLTCFYRLFFAFTFLPAFLSFLLTVLRLWIILIVVEWLSSLGWRNISLVFLLWFLLTLLSSEKFSF